MRLRLTQACTIGVLTVVFLCARIALASADGRLHYRAYRHHAPIAYIEAVPYDGNCRIGWWQTLRYGHVRPRWGEWCR